MMKRKFILWPHYLYVWHDKTDEADGHYERVGWVWLQRVTLFRNHYLGYIAVTKYINKPVKCSQCGQLLTEK